MLHLPLTCMTEIVPSATHSRVAFSQFFNVLVPFGGHIVAPHDTHIVIVVERCGRVGIMDGVAEFGQAGDHVSDVGHEACCSNFSFA